ncbi:MAG: hypothetical protein CMC35_01475 [Flavobacteriaceae bacterium]|nr:hypothetical protein [Flavobacteriaceae bacterium]|tara:strand:+ start:13995 stop:14468 length:474 start_codon:yes stop_codon:yes gene_type:complete
MKYARLTKEQLEELHEEFIRFLATQSITGEEWKQIKETKPQVAEEEIDIFSDLVWDGVLEKAEYLENLAPQQLFLFKIDASEMTLIALKIMDASKDITSEEGYRWLQQNYASEAVEFYTATKTFSEDKKQDIFSLIEKGAIITKGELFRFFEKIIEA